MDIEYSIDNAGNFSSREQDETLSFDGSVSVNLWVEVNETVKEKAVALVLDTNHFNFTILVKEGTTLLQMNVTEVALGDISIISTTFGTLDLDLLSEFLNLGIDLGVPFLNTVLEGLKLQIPDELFGLFKLSDLNIKYHNNYLEAGLTPTFEMPKQNIPGVYE